MQFQLSVRGRKAGQLVGLADCYAVLVLADNATFLSAVNRIPAYPRFDDIMQLLKLISTAVVAQLAEHLPLIL